MNATKSSQSINGDRSSNGSSSDWKLNENEIEQLISILMNFNNNPRLSPKITEYKLRKALSLGNNGGRNKSYFSMFSTNTTTNSGGGIYYSTTSLGGGSMDILDETISEYETFSFPRANSHTKHSSTVKVGGMRMKIHHNPGII